MHDARHAIAARLGLLCGLFAAAAAPATAQTSVRVADAAAQMIHDPRTGIAMFGYDPVAYHTEGKALAGRPQFAAEALGRGWRFVSAANMAAFLADPTPYLPLFGGHDGRGISENRMVRGDPAIFLLAGGRTVFFRTAEDRDAFASDAALRSQAMKEWPQVAAQFAGH